MIDRERRRAERRRRRIALRELYKQYGKLFDEIASLIAKQVGYADNPAALSEDERKDIVEASEEAIDRWDENTMKTPPPTPMTPLQHLLSRHHEVGEKILNIQHEALAAREEAC